MVKLFHSNLFLILMAPRFKFSLGRNVNHWIKSSKLHNEIVVLNSIFSFVQISCALFLVRTITILITLHLKMTKIPVLM